MVPIGDVLEILEWRHDFVSFPMTWVLLKYVLFNLIPDVLWHSPSQDEEQVRDHYDREFLIFLVLATSIY
jgi:sphingolipid C9-methyltransferase